MVHINAYRAGAEMIDADRPDNTSAVGNTDGDEDATKVSYRSR